MTPDRQQLKEALEYKFPDLDCSDECDAVISILSESAQAWYDLPDKLDSCKALMGDPKGVKTWNAAVDEIKEMVK